jgi:uncharacterized repeat protein (TIGR01451 family)/LPXTG-motif cell wall-anchored protein
MRTTRSRLLALAAAGALVGVPGATAAHAAGGDSNGKQTICHATSSDTNPYVINTPNKNGDVDGHADHTGPVWNPSLKDGHVWWGDIIPPFDYNEDGQTLHFDGLNWDADGQAWFANDCRVPITATLDKTNDADGDDGFTDDETTDAAGVDVPFSVTVTNTSAVPAVVVSVSDAVSGAPVAFTPTPDPVGTTLAPGASVTLTFTVPGYSPADGASTTNTFTASLAAVDDATNTGSASDTSTVRTVLPPPDVAVVKGGPAAASPGDDLTWTITVSNTGTVPATGVTVTDALPAGTTLVSVSGTGWSASGTSDLTLSLAGELAAGASSTVTVVATLAADYAEATVSNTAVVTPSDGTPDDNTSTVVTTVVQPGGGGGGGLTEEPFTGGGGGTTSLPRTGTSSWFLLAVGLLLLTSGTGLTVAARPVR